MKREDIDHLAELARIELTDSERETLAENITNVLGYVSQIDEITVSEEKKEVGAHYNIMREDEDPHEPGVYSDDIIGAMPDSQGRYLRVKKIIENPK